MGYFTISCIKSPILFKVSGVHVTPHRTGFQVTVQILLQLHAIVTDRRSFNPDLQQRRQGGPHHCAHTAAEHGLATQQLASKATHGSQFRCIDDALHCRFRFFLEFTVHETLVRLIVSQQVYKALDLFFHYGADPNVIARNNNESAMTMLLMHSLHEIPNELKARTIHSEVLSSACSVRMEEKICHLLTFSISVNRDSTVI